MPVKLKTSLQRFVRYSALGGSRRRASSRRRRSGRPLRQVRFQPIPTSINISAGSEPEPDEEHEDEDDEDLGWGSDFDEQSVSESTSSGSSLGEHRKPEAAGVQLLAVSSQLPASSAADDDSDASTGASSEHSGSQDSGHSTQHSGYSQVCRELASSLGPELHSDQLASIESQPASLGGGGRHSEASAGSEAPLVSSLAPTTPASSPLASPTGSGQADTDKAHEATDEAGSRRERFLQNRLIINRKLESLFASRSSPPRRQLSANLPPTTITTTPLNSQETACQQTGSGEAETRPFASSGPGSVQVMAAELETRMRLLKQQRQISLKLKQKPRQKAANKAALFLENSPRSREPQNTPSSYDDDDDDVPTGNEQSSARESLTKQLSMICLRQAGQLGPVGARFQERQVNNTPLPLPLVASAQNLHSTSDYHNSEACQRPSPSKSLSLAPRAAAVSLRQLVKEVIDDCERPNRLSATLLNKSNDSFSSAELSGEARGSSELENSGESRESSASFVLLRSGDETKHQQAGKSHFRWPESPTRIQPTARGCPPPTPTASVINYSPQTGQLPGDLSLSSLGTIEGLEYSRAGSELSVATLRATDDRKQPAAAAETGLRLHKSTLGSYLKSLREFSRFKLPKVRLMGAGGGATGNQPAEQKQTARLPFDHPGSEFFATAGLDQANMMPTLSSQQLHAAHFPPANFHQLSNNRQLFELPQGSRTLAWRAAKSKRASILDLPSLMMAPPQPEMAAAGQQLPTATNMPSLLQSGELTDHFVTISNRKWKSCHLRTSLKCLNNFE